MPHYLHVQMVHVLPICPTDRHLDKYKVMEGAGRGARAGCSGTVDILLIDRTVTLDCHRGRRDLSMAWNDVKKTYDSVGHGWLNGGILLHRSPVWLCRVMAKLCRSWNTRVLVVMGKGRETSQPIRFNKGVHEKVGLSYISYRKGAHSNSLFCSGLLLFKPLWDYQI